MKALAFLNILRSLQYYDGGDNMNLVRYLQCDSLAATVSVAQQQVAVLMRRWLQQPTSVVASMRLCYPFHCPSFGFFLIVPKINV